MARSFAWSWVAVAAAVAVGCGKDPEPNKLAPKPTASVMTSATASASSAATDKLPPPTNPDLDPLYGRFTLEDALQGLEGNGKVWADIETIAGKITCEMYADKAPLTVANFVGLARGVRPWKNAEGKWVKEPAYDNNRFHRVIKRFMIQGGAPRPEGGDPGYFFQDEIWEGATHDRPGLLCMANSGPNTNGMQFFITDAPCKHLDPRGHTIFGDCKPHATIHKIAATKTNDKDQPITTQTIKKVTIRRDKTK